MSCTLTRLSSKGSVVLRWLGMYAADSVEGIPPVARPATQYIADRRANGITSSIQ